MDSKLDLVNFASFVLNNVDAKIHEGINVGNYHVQMLLEDSKITF